MSKAKFDEKIAAQAGHAATISRQEYSEKIQRFLDLKRDPKLKKEPIDYKLLYKYDLVEEMDANGGVMVQTLVKKGTKLRFICREDLYDTINRVHVEMGHSGRDKMYEKLARIYANITKEAITSYLTLCEKCRPLKRPIAEMQNGEEATKSEVIEQPNLIEMPNGISDNFSLLEQPSTSVVSSFPNSIPSSSKPPHKRGRPCRNSIQKISGKRAASSSTLDSGEFSEGCSRRKISAQIVAISQLTTSNQFFGDQKGVPSTSGTISVSDPAQLHLPSSTPNLDLTQPPRSWWHYFHKLKEENQAICLTCGQAFNRGAKQSTTSLSHHLKMYHRNLYIAVQKARDEYARGLSMQNTIDVDGEENNTDALLGKLIGEKLDPVENQMDTAGDGQHVAGDGDGNRTFSLMGKQQLQMTAKRLIHAVRQFPELYVAASNPAKANENFEEVWMRIKQMIDQNGTAGDNMLIELKRRWFHLREKFKKELRFVLRDNFAYIPKWPHFNELIWLAPHFDEFRDIAHLLEDFVSSKSNESTGRMKGMNIDNSIEMRPHKLDDLLLPQDFEEVLNDRKASTSKEQGDGENLLYSTRCKWSQPKGNCHVFEQQKESQRNITIPLEERLLKQELDEQELREIAKALGIDVDAVQNGQLHMELEDVDTSFLMDKNGCCPSREAIQTIGYMLMNNDNSKNNSCCDDDRGRKDKANSSDGICGCSCTKIETSDDDEGVSQSEKEFGQMIARKLARLDEEERKNIKAKIMQLLERNHRNDSDSKMMK